MASTLRPVREGEDVPIWCFAKLLIAIAKLALAGQVLRANQVNPGAVGSPLAIKTDTTRQDDRDRGRCPPGRPNGGFNGLPHRPESGTSAAGAARAPGNPLRRFAAAETMTGPGVECPLGGAGGAG